MSRFTAKGAQQYSKPDTTAPSAARRLGGSYECHTCGVTVRGAYLEIDHGVLRWECKEGHRSQIEEFWL